MATFLDLNSARILCTTQQHARAKTRNTSVSSVAMRPDGPRDPVVGPDSGPVSPFPLKLNGKVIEGFGRGSKEVSASFTAPRIRGGRCYRYPRGLTSW